MFHFSRAQLSVIALFMASLLILGFSAANAPADTLAPPPVSLSR